MSVQYDRTRAKFVVRWREGGKQRVRRFALEPDALAFDAEVNPRGRSAERAANPGGRIAAAEQAANLTSRRTAGQARDGIYAYGTNAGVRWRFVFRQSDGTLSSRRGFTSRTAAADAKRRLLEGIRRGEVRVSRETFETFWHRVLREKRPFMTAGSYEDFATQGRKRLIPFLGDDRLSSIDEARVRDWLGTMVELIDAGEFAPKTVNNARTYLSVVLNEAVRRGHLVRNPCESIPQLPADAAEIDFLRLGEIDGYLDACADLYKPLAEFLIGSGARVSEAVAVCWQDFDFKHGVVRIYRQRARDMQGTARTKGKRFRGVQIGPRPHVGHPPAGALLDLRQHQRGDQPADGRLAAGSRLRPRPHESVRCLRFRQDG
jgi:hypothetical protein